MTNQIMAFLDGSLDPNQLSKFQNHLETCEICQKELAELQSMQDMLGERKRPEIPITILRSYETSLRNAFPVQSMWTRLKHTVDQMSEWMVRFSPYPQWAGAVAILIVGILIGRFVFYPGTSTSLESETVTIQTAPLSDRESISQFLIQSEIWLLEMASTPVNGSDSELDLLTNREIASTLLARTMLMERKAETLNHDILIDFLNRLEMVLLETSGAEDENLSQAFEEIRLTIQETAMVHEIKRIHRSLRIRAGDNI